MAHRIVAMGMKLSISVQSAAPQIICYILEKTFAFGRVKIMVAKSLQRMARKDVWFCKNYVSIVTT
jgi:hypothetical protein